MKIKFFDWGVHKVRVRLFDRRLTGHLKNVDGTIKLRYTRTMRNFDAKTDRFFSHWRKHRAT